MVTNSELKLLNKELNSLCQTSLRHADAIHNNVNYSKALRHLNRSIEKSLKGKSLKLSSIKHELRKSGLGKKISSIPDREIDIFHLKTEILRMIKTASVDIPNAKKLGLLD